ncbi:MAG: FAD-dependent oxidoreductase [Thermodesulfobacteriota bacterium]
MKFPRLFSPIQIKGLRLKNRIMMPAMVVGFADPRGYITDRYLKYMEARAKGGTGLLVTEAAYVTLPGKILPGEVGIYDDTMIPGLARLAEAVHRHGAKLAVQLNHGGRQTHPSISGYEVVAPSPLPCPRRQAMPRALTSTEIEELVRAFALAAARAQKAGVDAVEIHGAHGYLINQFMSPYSNKRTDRYGADREGRLRFPLEILAAVRARTGPDFPIIFRLSADEYVPGGLTLEESIPMAKNLASGGVDVLHVTGGVYESIEMTAQPMQIPQGCLTHLARAIKKELSIPVATVGRIVEPSLAEQILTEGTADLVAMGRALIADPNLAAKARRGEEDDICRCVGCMQGCLGVHDTPGIKCLQNPAVGRDEEAGLPPALNSKRVLIVGGGPAGLEAARVAAGRGHQVELYEQAETLGGQINLASIPPGKKEFLHVRTWREKKIKELGVEVHLSTKMTVDKVIACSPEVVVLATGSRPALPAIPGLEKVKACTAQEVLSGFAIPDKQITVLGGGLVGCETALFLVERDKDVAVIEMLAELAKDAQERMRNVMLRDMNRKGIKAYTNAKVIALTERGVVAEQAGARIIVPADFLVLALGAEPERSLAEGLKGSFPGGLYQIGDCSTPRNALYAIEEAFNAGLTI